MFMFCYQNVDQTCEGN